MNALLSLQDGIFTMISNPAIIIALVLGVFGGLIFGAIPGLTATLGITLMLPFTYAMPPTQGLTTLIAIYVGGISGGLVAAVLLNIPGTPSSIITTFDGSPMARKGMPGDALALGVLGSLIGGLISAVALLLIAPKLAHVALMFGAWEYFAIGIMGLCVVVSICSDDLIKGFMSATTGILLAMVGYDLVSGIARFTYGRWELGSGLASLAVLMALFAFSEILTQANNLGVRFEKVPIKKVRILPSRSLLKGTGRVFGIGSVIGTIIGILPGIGQTTASLLSYNISRQTSKNPEEYGKGCAEGIIASESANNAVCGGALVPMITLGIPGDLTTSILLGGLIIHGLQPGPNLFLNNTDVVNIVYTSYFLACIIMFILFIIFMKLFVKVLSVPSNYLYSTILLMCIIGTYTVNNRLFDCWVLIIIGVFGFILLKSGFSLTPIVLGYILGPLIETNFRTAIISNYGNILSIWERPIAIVMLLVGVILIILPGLLNRIKKIIHSQ